jgi:hypothetical protein
MKQTRKSSLVETQDRMDTGAMLVLALAAAPASMAFATAAERRFGPAVAGWIGAMPTTIVIAMLAVGADLGRHAAATLAASAAAHVGAQVAFAVVFAAAVRRGGLAALLAGTAAFAALSLVIAEIPVALAITAAVPALALGPRLVPDDVPSGPVEGNGVAEAAVRAAVAALAVAVAFGVARALGPATAGATTAYPALSATLALLVLRARGAGAAARALRGLCCGLPGYLGFCVTIALVTPRIGVVAAVPLALGACLVVFRATWSAVRPAAAAAGPA